MIMILSLGILPREGLSSLAVKCLICWGRGKDYEGHEGLKNWDFIHFPCFILSFKVLAYFFFFFSGLFTVLNLIFLHSFKNFWHQGRNICLEGFVDNV